MLQTRTASGSGSGMMPTQAHQNQQYGASQQQRNYHTSVATTAPMSYRGSAAPIQPYAFTSTPSLTPTGQRQPHANPRSSSSSAVPTTHTFIDQNGYPRSRHVANASLPNLPMNMVPSGSRDDSSLPAPMIRRGSTTPRPQSAYFSSSTVQTSFASASPAKSQPDRYRRPSHRGTDTGSPGQQISPTASVTPNTASKERRPSPSNLNRPNSFYAKVPGTVDDMQLGRNANEPKRFRRRSMPALDAASVPNSLAALDLQRPEQAPVSENASTGAANKDKIKTARLVPSNISAPAKNGSSESLVSSRSSNSRPSSVSGPIRAHPRTNCPISGNMQPAPSLTRADECCPQSANRNNVHIPTGNPAQLAKSPDKESSDAPKLINIPARTSSTDAAKRISSPSPLSKPVTMDTVGQKDGSSATATKPAKVDSKADTAEPNKTYESPAAKQLAAINQKGGKLKSKTSRLRRALSFSSAAELRKAGAGPAAVDNGIPPATPRGDNDSTEELSPEQARIAEQQEAAGLGHNIYAGNSRMFAASTDNISISSTASSASIMIRKMGRGMKKGGRSLAGLFRPKSVIGVPPPDTAEGSQATVSMVTVEAERERVNVNAEPNSPDGGTDYPRLERNSIDASQGLNHERSGSSGTDNSAPRKSIVGGDRERAEVLAAVRKGILKRKCRQQPLMLRVCLTCVQTRTAPPRRARSPLRVEQPMNCLPLRRFLTRPSRVDLARPTTKRVTRGPSRLLRLATRTIS